MSIRNNFPADGVPVVAGQPASASGDAREQVHRLRSHGGTYRAIAAGLPVAAG